MRTAWVALTAGAAASAGVAMLAVGVHHIRALGDVGLQLPWLISSCVAALAVIGTAAGVLVIHVNRVDRARLRAASADLCETLGGLAAQTCTRDEA